MTRTRFYPESDMLSIRLSGSPSAYSKEVQEGIVLDYDENDKIVAIEISDASELVDVADIRANPAEVVDDSGEPVTLTPVTHLAEELGVTRRALQMTMRKMREAGIDLPRGVLQPEHARLIKKWKSTKPKERSALFAKLAASWMTTTSGLHEHLTSGEIPIRMVKCEFTAPATAPVRIGDELTDNESWFRVQAMASIVPEEIELQVVEIPPEEPEPTVERSFFHMALFRFEKGATSRGAKFRLRRLSGKSRHSVVNEMEG